MKTETIQSKVYGEITKEQAVAILRQRMADWASKPQGVSFGKAPKDGWTDEDRIK